MAGDRDVQFYLEDPLRQSAARGEHPFLALVAEVLVEAGLRPVYAPPVSASVRQCRGLFADAYGTAAG